MLSMNWASTVDCYETRFLEGIKLVVDSCPRLGLKRSNCLMGSLVSS